MQNIAPSFYSVMPYGYQQVGSNIQQTSNVNAVQNNPNEAFSGEVQTLQNLYLNYANSNRYAYINGAWQPMNNNVPNALVGAIKDRLINLNALPEIPKTN